MTMPRLHRSTPKIWSPDSLQLTGVEQFRLGHMPDHESLILNDENNPASRVRIQIRGMARVIKAALGGSTEGHGFFCSPQSLSNHWVQSSPRSAGCELLGAARWPHAVEVKSLVRLERLSDMLSYPMLLKARRPIVDIAAFRLRAHIVVPPGP